jgi:hypothetical protein
VKKFRVEDTKASHPGSYFRICSMCHKVTPPMDIMYKVREEIWFSKEAYYGMEPVIKYFCSENCANMYILQEM